MSMESADGAVSAALRSKRIGTPVSVRITDCGASQGERIEPRLALIDFHARVGLVGTAEALAHDVLVRSPSREHASRLWLLLARIYASQGKRLELHRALRLEARHRHVTDQGRRRVEQPADSAGPGRVQAALPGSSCKAVAVRTVMPVQSALPVQ